MLHLKYFQSFVSNYLSKKSAFFGIKENKIKFEGIVNLPQKCLRRWQGWILSLLLQFDCFPMLASSVPWFDFWKKLDEFFIPDICHFFYTNTFWGLEILLSKVRKFATKICSRQNSVNYILCVKLHTVCKIYTLCVILYTVCKITHCVQNYTLCKLHTVCKITHSMCNYTLCVNLLTVWNYTGPVCKITHCV